MNSKYLFSVLLSSVLLSVSSVSFAEEGNPKTDKMFERKDVNKDGKLQLGEVSERMKEHFPQADANQDGSLTKEEVNSFFEKKSQEHFTKLDVDGDKKLSFEEWKKGRHHGRHGGHGGHGHGGHGGRGHHGGEPKGEGRGQEKH